MPSERKIVTFNTIAIGLVISTFVTFVGMMIYNDRVQSQSLKEQSNKIVAIESKPVVDAKESLTEINKQLVILNSQLNLLALNQASTEAKLQVILLLSRTNSARMDNFIRPLQK